MKDSYNVEEYAAVVAATDRFIYKLHIITKLHLFIVSLPQPGGHGFWVCSFVCLVVCFHDNWKATEWICLKFHMWVVSDQRKK